MRHNYPTEAIVLARHPLAEESASLTLLTRDVGLVRARAQGIRKRGAKLAAALQTWSSADVVLVAGKEGWRVSGAVLKNDWFSALPPAARTRAARTAALLLRLVRGEAPDEKLFDFFRAYFAALSSNPEEGYDALECLAALRLLSHLGLDAGPLPGSVADPFSKTALVEAAQNRTECVRRVNRGIAASGL